MSKSISPSPRHAQGFSLLRVLFCGILLTVLVAGCLYLHHTAFAFSALACWRTRARPSLG